MRRFIIPLIAILFLVMATSTVLAQTKVSGTLSMTYTMADSLIVGDTKGHKMGFNESKGTNKCTSDNDIMDGAEGINFSYSDLVMGTGPQQGYITLVIGEDMTIAKWNGEVKTAMSDEGKPVTTFSGDFIYIFGSGQFENIKGSGSYTGNFTSPTDYNVDWTAEYSLE
jgi:hypothetical protein